MQSDRIQSSAIFIATIVATGSIAINAAIPGIPDMQATLSLARDNASSIVAIFVVGYAIGHIIVGIISPAAPQKELLLGGLVGFIVCSVSIGFSEDPANFAWLRGLQGAFASVCPIIGRALVRNIGVDRQAAKKMSTASAIFTWAPVVAPLLAAAITVEFGWRAVYFALAAYASAGAVWVLLSPRRRFTERNESLRIAEHLRSMIEVSHHPFGRAGLIVGSLAFAAFFSFLAVAPNLSSDWQTAPISLATVITLYSGGYAVGAIVSRLALNHVGEIEVLKASLVVLVIAGILQGLATYLAIGFGAQIGCSVVCAVAAGAAMPNATMMAMRPSLSIAPLSLALLGMTKMALAAVVAAIAGWTGLSADTYVSVVATSCGIASLLVILESRRQISRSPG